MNLFNALILICSSAYSCQMNYFDDGTFWVATKNQYGEHLSGYILEDDKFKNTSIRKLLDWGK